MSPTADSIPEGLALGPYDLEEPLARGAMGEVWRGRHRVLDVPVAVKLLLATHAEDGWAETSFANEVRATAGLSHPGIVMVLDHGVVDEEAAGDSGGRMTPGCPFLVMELLAGISLQGQVGRLPWAEIREILLQLLSALAHSHARGVIHRDLKPGNVLIEPASDRGGWRARITDFGLAQAIDRHASSDRVVAGTPAYMAPEQLQGDWRDQGPWTDLYSLACMAWALAAGQPPFGRSRDFLEICGDHLHRPPPALSPLMPVPEAFEGWLRRLLEKDPQRRYASAADAAAALRTLDALPLLEPLGQQEPPSAEGPLVVGEPLPPSHDDQTTGAPRALPDRPPAVPEISTQVLPEDMPAAPEVAHEAPPGHDPLPLSRIPVPGDWRSESAPPPEHRLLGVGISLYGLRAIPLVNRQRERSWLWESLSRLEQRPRAAAVVLRGPSGSGKSRLAEWLCESAHELAGATVLKAWHSASGGASVGLPAMLSRHLRCTGMDRAALAGRLARVNQRAHLVEPDELPALAELLQPGLEGEGDSSGAPIVRFRHPRERWALIRRVLEGIDPLPRPVVLWLDDVQWGPEAMAFTEWLLGQQDSRPVPVLIVMTAQEAALVERPDEAIALERLAHRDAVRVIDVGPLAIEDHASLVRTLLGMDGDLVAQVTRRTAGNPLFAVQLIGDWVTRGLLVPGRRGFRLKDGVTVDIPDDLHAVWRSRVERVLDGEGEADEQALELAATLGDKVDTVEWRAVCARTGARPDTRRLLARLLLLRLARLDSDGEGWSFTHPMLRESLVRRAREAGRSAAWHRACATMLELRNPNRTGVADRIAWHLLEAGDDRDALGYLLAAAQDGVNKGDLEPAERLLDEWDATLDRLDVSREDRSRMVGSFLRIRLLRVLGRSDEVARLVAFVADLARRERWQPELIDARVQEGLLWHRRGQFFRAWRRLRAAEDLARNEVLDPVLLARVLQEEGRLLLERGLLTRANAALASARPLFVAAAQESEEANCGWLLGRVAKQAGDLDRAMAHFTDALSAFERIGARYGMASCTNELGEVARLQGDLDSAEIHYRDALVRMDELGADDAHVMRLNLAQVLLNRGRPDEAADLLQQSLRAFEGSAHRAMTGIVHTMLLSCAAAADDWQGWDRHADAASAVLAETGWVEHDVALAARMAGDLADDAGQADRARRAWRMALAQWERLDRPEEVAQMRSRLAGRRDG